MAASPNRIETPRLVLRRPVLGDADGLFAMLSDPKQFYYSPVPLVRDPMQVKHIIVDWDEQWDKGMRTYVVSRKSAVSEPIGFVNIGPDEELGGALMQNATGAGLGEEVMQALIPTLGLTRAWTLIDADVKPLIRLLEKFDFYVEKVLRRRPCHRLPTGKPRAVAHRAPGHRERSSQCLGDIGPWAGRRGFDSIVQAASGISLIEGTHTPGALPAQALDHATGYFLAAGIVDALTERLVEGRGRTVAAALARTANWLLTQPRSAELADTTQPGDDTLVTHAGRRTARPAAADYDDYAFPARPWGRDAATWNWG